MKMKIDPTEVALDIIKQESKHRQAMAILMDQYLSKEGKIFAIKVEMGGSESYIGSVSLEWFAGRVRFAASLPMFQEKVDFESAHIKIDAETIELIQQRPLDWTRQAVLAQYLAARPIHKFPPVLAVISQPWVDDPESDAWDSRRKALRSSVDFLPLDNEGRVGLLDVSEESMIYALDGQHRLMGVIGLMEIIKNGHLQRLRQDKTPKQDFITIEDLVDRFGMRLSDLQKLGSEHIGIEFFCAVSAGETRIEALQRVRSIFVHVNMQAKRLSKGQLHVLDEDNGFAIVARSVAVSHPILREKADRHARVEFNKSSLRENDNELTTLQTLTDMATGYLLEDDPYMKWRSTEAGLVPLRPSDDELTLGITEFMNLWNRIAKLPSFRKIEQGPSPKDLRKFTSKGGEAHMLFRPIGQFALAHALGVLVFQRGKKLELIFKKLAEYDKNNGFQIDIPQSIWWGVLYDHIRKKMIATSSGRELAKDILMYLLGGGIPDDEEREQLRAKIVNLRRLEDDVIIGFDEKHVSNEEDFQLPSVL